jgi:hypothetical protein
LFFSSLMKPPSDQLLDTSGACIDLPAPARPRYGLRWPVVLGVATLLAILSSALAISFTRALGRPAANWTSLVVLNATYWYVWALFTPSIVWLSQHFRFERQGLVRAFLIHIPSVALFSFAHIACMAGIQWWLASGKLPYPFWSEVKRAALMNFDWEMMTYWAIIGTFHSVTYYGESQERALKSSRLETQLAEAQLQALQRQLHPHFLFNTLNAISALMHRDVEAADQMLSKLSDLLRMTLENLGRHESTLKAGSISVEMPSKSSRRVSPIAWSSVRRRAGARRAPPTLLLQPSSERDQARRIEKTRAGPHRHPRAAGPRQALDRGPRRRLRLVRNGPDGPSEGHWRVDDTGAPAAPVRCGFPVRVPPAGTGCRGGRRRALANRCARGRAQHEQDLSLRTQNGHGDDRL